MADFAFVQAAVTVGFGALAGGLTNAVAIWMLFHPYEPRRFGWLLVQGALPKNKARLAKTIGRTVGQRLLTSDDLVRQLRTGEMRAAFDAALRDLLVSLLDTPRGSLRDTLPSRLHGELDALADRVAEVVGERLGETAATESFRDAVARFVTRAQADLADAPVGEFLTTERRQALRARLEDWAADAVEGEDAERVIDAWIERQLARLSDDRTPLLDRLPSDLVGAVERAIAGYLPVAIEHLATTLRDPEARLRLQRALHQLFDRFARDLLLHQRIMARLVVTERTVARLLDTFEREGAEQVGHLLEEPEMRAEIAKSVNDAVVQFLRRPVAEHLNRLGPERVAGVRAAAARWIVNAVRDPKTRGYVLDRLDEAVARAERRTWGELLRHVPPTQVAEWLARAAATPQARAWVVEGTRGGLGVLMDRPLGRPADWFGPDAVERLTTLLAPALWEWIESQVPAVVKRLDVARMVEDKVLGFSLPRMEEIVRNTTQRELDLIVRLGYLLGGIVGAIAYGITLLV